MSKVPPVVSTRGRGRGKTGKGRGRGGRGRAQQPGETQPHSAQKLPAEQVQNPASSQQTAEIKQAVTSEAEGCDSTGCSAVSHKPAVIQQPSTSQQPIPNFAAGTSRTVNMSGPVAEFVKTKINSDNVVIFSKSYCPYCRMAKEVFDKMKQKYTVVELDQREDEGEMQDVLGHITGARTVPRVFLKGKFIGGGTDVQKLYGTGELQKMIGSE